MSEEKQFLKIILLMTVAIFITVCCLWYATLHVARQWGHVSAEAGRKIYELGCMEPDGDAAPPSYGKWRWEKGQDSAASDFSAPVRNYIVSSRFGWRSLFGARKFHYGVDLAARTGEPILASKPGIVAASGYGGGYGLLVILRHEDGFETRYGHCSALYVREGDYVARGEMIALVGSTGRSTGPHLHFETRLEDEALDPELVMDF